MRKTKIVATLGPASSSPEMIGQLMDAGVSVIRLNFSHGAREAHAENIARIRELAHARDRMVPIMADLQGPKIRVGQLEGDQPVEFRRRLCRVIIAQPQFNHETGIAPAAKFGQYGLPECHNAIPRRIRPSFTAASLSERSSKTKSRAALP